MTWLDRLWTAVRFFFKPTYRVFPCIQAAVDALPPHGGTLLLAAGRYEGGVTLPDKPVRIIGSKKEETVLGMVTGGAAITIGIRGRAVIKGLLIQGPLTPAGSPASPQLAAYLDVESAVEHLDAIGSPLADRLRDAMDPLWFELTDADRTYLNGRPGSTQA